MAAKRSWRRTSLFWVNVALWLTIAVLGATWHRELRWAATELPGYLDGNFSDPPERQLYWQARQRLDRDATDPEARRLLERSLAIDPHGEAAYWLGVWFEENGDDDAARDRFESFLAEDKTRVDAWLRLAGIQRRQGRPDQARQLLERGVAHFAASAELQVPRRDPTVDWEYNEKAREIHEEQLQALELLRQALASAP